MTTTLDSSRKAVVRAKSDLLKVSKQTAKRLEKERDALKRKLKKAEADARKTAKKLQKQAEATTRKSGKAATASVKKQIATAATASRLLAGCMAEEFLTNRVDGDLSRRRG